MRVGPAIHKLFLAAHVATSLGLAGAVASFLTLAAAGLVGGAEAFAYSAMGLVTLWLVAPLALATLAVGIAQSLVTPWGLFRHWWVVIKLGLTAVATGVLFLQVGTIRQLAMLSEESLAAPAARAARASMVLHAAGGLAVLFLALALSVWKPRGLTRRGWRKRLESARPAATGP